MVVRVLEVAKVLKEEEKKIDARVIEIHTIKPLNVDIIIRAAEEHFILLIYHLLKSVCVFAILV